MNLTRYKSPKNYWKNYKYEYDYNYDGFNEVVFEDETKKYVITVEIQLGVGFAQKIIDTVVHVIQKFTLIVICMMIMTTILN